jgi:hypothetical protein
MIDQAIKEQEALMSTGPGSHPAPILLPLQVPRWSKTIRTIYSPVEDEELDKGLGEQGNESGVTLGIVAQDGTDVQAPRRKGKKGRPKMVQKKPPQIAVAQEEAYPDPELATRRNTRTLRPRDPVNRTAATDQKYCYCQEDSFGKVRPGSY